MGGILFNFKKCMEVDLEEKEFKINQKDKTNYLNELFDRIIFNRNDYENLISEITINDGLEKKLYDFTDSSFFEQKYGINIQPKKNNTTMKDLLFYYYNQTLDKKLGIIVILSSDIKVSFNRFQILLNKLEKILNYDTSKTELIHKNCSIFLLNNKYEDFEIIKICADLKENDLPSILFVKKDFKEQPLDADCIKYITSDFEDVDLFFDTLFNFLEVPYNGDNNIQTKNTTNDKSDEFYDRQYQKQNLLIPDNKNNDHNYFIIEDEKKYNTFKDDFDSMNLSNKNNNNIIDSQKSNKEIKSYITEKEIKEAKENLNIEPDEDNEDSTEIIIRYPNTGKRASRRFLKENKIQYLYNYILSLDDLLEEINYQQFKMSQPFPLKYFEDLDESFENYGLYPDGIIDIYVKE